MKMDEVALQAQRADEGQRLVDPLRRTPQHTVAKEDERDRQGDVKHALDKQRELAMPHLLQEKARGESHYEHEDQHPHALTVDGPFLPHHLSHIDTDKEDRHTTPEDLDMAYGMMDGGDPFNKNAPHDHHYGQPAIDRMPLDELHVRRGKEVKHHDSRDVPEVKLVVQPEAPVGSLSRPRG